MNDEQNRNEEQNEPGKNTGYTTFTPVTDNTTFSPPEGPQKHAGLGIASFILALAALLGVVLSLVLSVSFATQFTNADPTEIERALSEGDAELATIMGVGLLIIGSIGLSFIGLILGIIGVFIKNRKKVFSIIGIVLNGLLVVGSLFLVIIGVALGSAV